MRIRKRQQERQITACPKLSLTARVLYMSVQDNELEQVVSGELVYSLLCTHQKDFSERGWPTEYTECWTCPLFDILLKMYFHAGQPEPEFLNILKCNSAESAKTGFQFTCYDIFSDKSLNSRHLDHFSGLLKFTENNFFYY